MSMRIFKLDTRASNGLTKSYALSFISPRYVERYVTLCVLIVRAQGHPSNPGPSARNIDPRQPFEVASMDFVTHIPKSERENTFLVLFQDMFPGFVTCKPMSSTTAQDVAEAYEELVFRMFGASALIRHD
ncbi:LOW QUALITY PROTEIN: reverse transcriptase [Phytophthora megakarya]|uniref:Reverse transcriptase n=1 Tax=Phytophthora megakarya TaxID=4795 RepID=A0A225WBJ6_9STRA|nr:LOW QUALITY PROTEIN: reverse transcriptase [Phytophthora megakarya]